MKSKEKKRIRMSTIVVAIEMTFILFSILTSIIMLSTNINNYRNENKEHIISVLKANEKQLEERKEALISFSYELMSTQSFQYLQSHYYEMKEDYYSHSLLINECKNDLNTLIAYYPITYSSSVYISGNDEFDDIYISTMDDESLKEKFDYFKENYSLNKFFYVYDDFIYFAYGKEDLSALLTIKLSDEYLLSFFLQGGTLFDKNKSFKCKNADGELAIITTNVDNMNDFSINDESLFTNEAIIEGSTIYVKYYYLDSFYLYTVISLHSIIIRLFLPMLLIFLFIFICEIIVGVLLTYNLASKPMKNVLESMEKVEEGDFSIQIKDHTITDFQDIYDGFNKMAASLNSSINENYIQQLRIKESEFKYLQSQINPHFLYNCFANISSLCQINDNETAFLLTKHLSKYYFYITEGQAIVNLEDEYNNLMHFLQIQKIRFGDRVIYDIDEIQKEAQKILIPKLTLQPIVENSFKYTFSKISHGGILRIRSYQEYDYYIIKISDNGNILTNEDVERLNKKIANSSLVGQHGLTNIYRRLEYYSNGKSTIHLSIGELKGLQVEIRLYIGEENEKN